MNPQSSPPVFQNLPTKSNKVIVAAILFAVLFVAAAGFGGWAYQGRASYKNDAASQTAEAVSAAKKVQLDQDQAEFAALLKKPYKSFSGPDTYGSVRLSYPKSWSAYIDQTNSSTPINGYFYPDVVPATSSATAFALRIEVTNTPYASVVGQYQQSVEQGSLKAAAFVPAKLSKNAKVQRGTRFDGTFNSNQTGAMIVMPMRNETLQVYTQSKDFLNDFNNIVLPSLTFSP